MEHDRSVTRLLDEVRQGRLTRRDVLKRAAALGLSAPAIAALLAACGGGGGAPTATSGTTGGAPTGTATAAGGSPTAAASPTTAATGQYTGTRGGGELLKLLWWQAPTILNGHLSQGTKDFDASRPVLEPLADVDDAGNLVPILAAEIPSLENGGVAKDGKSVTWKLKQGVKWSDGEPFTSKDVKFTYEYVINEKTNATTLGNYKVIDSIDTPDDYTVVVKFKQPTPGWTTAFVGPYGYILPEHLLRNSVGEKAAQDPYNLKPIGTGPYKVEEFRPGDVVVYTLNENFREPDKPFFKRVEMKGGGDATSAARAAVQTGDVDYAWNLQVEEQVLKSLEAAGGPGVISVTEGTSVERILINMTDPNKEVNGERSSLKAPHPFQSDLEVRKAYALLVDRDAIATGLYGRAGKATANILVAPEAFVSKNTSWKFDVEAAKKQLDSAGWTMQGNVRAKNGVQMKILYQTTVNPVRQKTQEIVKKAFEQAGIQVELKSIDSKVFFSSDAGNPDTAAHFYADIEMFTNGPTLLYPLDYMVSWWGDPSNIAQKSNNWSGSNYERWQNAEYDQAYTQAQTELDPEKQKELMIKMNDLVINNVVLIPQVHRGNVQGYNKALKNLNLSRWTSDLWNLASWQK